VIESELESIAESSAESKAESDLESSVASVLESPDASIGPSIVESTMASPASPSGGDAVEPHPSPRVNAAKQPATKGTDRCIEPRVERRCDREKDAAISRRVQDTRDEAMSPPVPEYRTLLQARSLRSSLGLGERHRVEPETAHRHPAIMRRILYMGLPLACLLYGCGSSSSSSPGCVPGESIACACVDGTGAQVCNDEGTAYGECRCAPPDGSTGDSSVGKDTGTISDSGIDSHLGDSTIRHEGRGLRFRFHNRLRRRDRPTELGRDLHSSSARVDDDERGVVDVEIRKRCR
jgi:hypothetical protein